jgi:hypothetical protein
VRRWRELVTGKNGGILLDRPKPTTGCSANGEEEAEEEEAEEEEKEEEKDEEEEFPSTRFPNTVLTQFLIFPHAI